MFLIISWKIRLQQILSLTKQHAMGLAGFVTVYKILLLVQRWLNGNKPRPLDTFIAGLFGGYVVFGDRTAVNEQVRSQKNTDIFLSFFFRRVPIEFPPPHTHRLHYTYLHESYSHFFHENIKHLIARQHTLSAPYDPTGSQSSLYPQMLRGSACFPLLHGQWLCIASPITVKLSSLGCLVPCDISMSNQNGGTL